MDYEVVVVGGGIGGLTVAALLAARGTNVCLFERQPEVGGCAATFAKFGLEFEQSDGLYSSWEPGAIHDRVFSELPVVAPETRLLDPAYEVRLPDHSQLLVGTDSAQLEEQLRRVFPECVNEAIEFYRHVHDVSKNVGLLADRVTNLSFRFRRFLEAQLQILAQGNIQGISFRQAALLLSQAQGGLFAIQGGVASLATRLAESIKLSGGKVRVDAPVLRLAYDSAGQAIGIDLLSGERVTASRAIVSNLTLWDTYGKLLGLARSPSNVRATLKAMHSSGAYLLFLSAEDAALQTLAAQRIVSIADWQTDSDFEPQDNLLVFNASSMSRDATGRRAVTIHAFIEPEDWFSFHTDAEETEAKDQDMLEACWIRLHEAMPELGSGVEVIETMTPRDYYENTRRKLGMVGSAYPMSAGLTRSDPPFLTSLPNLFVVSDTAHLGGISEVTRLAFALAGHISANIR